MSDSFATPWILTYQAPLSMGYPRQEYWSGLPFPSPGDLLDPGIEPKSPALVGRFFTIEPPRKPYSTYKRTYFNSGLIKSSLLVDWTKLFAERRKGIISPKPV